MPENEIRRLIPHYGDRVIIKSYCEKNKKSNVKQSLIEKLRQKLESKRGRGNEPAETLPKKNFRKNTRYIEIGWLCGAKKLSALRQVRAKYGGGTKRISVPKTFTCHDILKEALNLFFPNGISTKGSIERYNIEILDYKQQQFSDLSLTVQDIYNISALTNLRFYLATTQKHSESSEESDTEYIPYTTTRADDNSSTSLTTVTSADVPGNIFTQVKCFIN